MDFLDTINQEPTRNEQEEIPTLAKKQKEENKATPSSPLGAQAAGLGPDAAKMAGTPNALKGKRNEQQERLETSAAQSQQAVDPQGQTVEDYQRNQDIQQQTLGQAQEAANRWEEEMKAAGAGGAGNVSKYIMQQTYDNLEAAQQTTYIEEVLGSSKTQEKFLEAVNVPIEDITDEQRQEMSKFIEEVLGGAKPEELNLVALQNSLGLENEDQKFEDLVKQIQKDSYESIQNIGDQIAEGLINAEEITIKQLMEEDLISEEDIRDSLGLFNGEPLPDNWEDMSYDEIESLASRNFEDEAEGLEQQAIQAGLGYDVGGGYSDASDVAEARERQANRVEFGDSLVDKDKFLDNDRVRQEMNRLGPDFDYTLEGEDLDKELKRVYGEAFEDNPEYYRELYEVAKTNNSLKDNVDYSTEQSAVAIEKGQQKLEEVKGLIGDSTGDIMNQVFGINLNTWDINSKDFGPATDILVKHGEALRKLLKDDPDFLATLKKEPDQSWEDFSKELDEKVGGVAHYDKVQAVNKHFREDGTYVGGNEEEFMKDFFGIEKGLLDQIISNKEWNEDALAMFEALPTELTDGKITAAEAESISDKLKGGYTLDSLVDVDLLELIDNHESRVSGDNVINWEANIGNTGFSDTLATKTDDYVSFGAEHFDKMNDEEKLKWTDTILKDSDGEFRNLETNPPSDKEVKLIRDNYSNLPDGAKADFVEYLTTKTDQGRVRSGSGYFEGTSGLPLNALGITSGNGLGGDSGAAVTEEIEWMMENTPEVMLSKDNGQGGLLYDMLNNYTTGHRVQGWNNGSHHTQKMVNLLKSFKTKYPNLNQKGLQKLIDGAQKMTDHLNRSRRQHTANLGNVMNGRGLNTDNNRKPNGKVKAWYEKG